MKKVLRSMIKRLGLAVLPDSDFLRSLFYRPKFESWRKARGGDTPIFRKREELYDLEFNS